MMRNRYRSAYNALLKFRPSSLQAARDLYYIHAALKVEERLREGKQLWREMFVVPRNRRAAQSAFFVMFMQQVGALQLSPNGRVDCSQCSVLWGKRHNVLLIFDVSLCWV